MTVDEAYAVQQRMIARRRESGLKVVGKKIGLTSKVVQNMLGVDQPDFGYLLSDMLCSDGDAIEAAALIAPKIEGEIAFVLKGTLAGPGITSADGPAGHRVRGALLRGGGLAHPGLEDPHPGHRG